NWYGLTADVSAMYGGASLFASFFYHQTDSGAAYIQGGNNFTPASAADIGTTEVWGATLQASYYLLPNWEVFGRFEYGSASTGELSNITAPTGATSLDNGNDLMLLSVGLNWYIDGEDFKWTSDVGVSLDKVDGIWWNGNNGWRASGEEHEIVLRTQLQMAF
ncbi:MAG: hypothetical protein RLZZ238_2366, partial [Planctomycetota bacterium]